VTDARFADTELPVGVDDVEMAVFDGEMVLFRESTRMVHRLNSVAGAVWLLCDGETAVGSMAAQLGEVFGAEPASLVDVIHQALGQLADEGLLAGGEAPQRLRLEPVEEHAPDGSRLLGVPPDP
jgi:hypothetical protein